MRVRRLPTLHPTDKIGEPMNTLKLYDSARRAKVPFEPLVAGKVSMYVCGPTVYDDIHIGNARTFLSFDVIRRWLVARGYEDTFAQNLTDVDDKIINRANERGVDPAELARANAAAFIDVMHRFGILDPDIRPRATEEIPAMIEMIGGLVEGGHAYASGGDVYFSVRSDPDYGCVSGRNVDDLMVGARIEAGELKRDPLDFALWKAAKPGEPTWDSPWGPGRPGWHSECAAMVHRYLGMPVDIHGGGSDLAFPHHENECAQARMRWGGEFANHWMHTGMLLVDGEKMSKSLGNFYTSGRCSTSTPRRRCACSCCRPITAARSTSRSSGCAARWGRSSAWRPPSRTCAGASPTRVPRPTPGSPRASSRRPRRHRPSSRRAWTTTSTPPAPWRPTSTS